MWAGHADTITYFAKQHYVSLMCSPVWVNWRVVCGLYRLSAQFPSNSRTVTVTNGVRVSYRHDVIVSLAHMSWESDDTGMGIMHDVEPR